MSSDDQLIKIVTSLEVKNDDAVFIDSDVTKTYVNHLLSQVESTE
jgi:hypothetical protein